MFQFKYYFLLHFLTCQFLWCLLLIRSLGAYSTKLFSSCSKLNKEKKKERSNCQICQLCVAGNLGKTRKTRFMHSQYLNDNWFVNSWFGCKYTTKIGGYTDWNLLALWQIGGQNNKGGVEGVGSHCFLTWSFPGKRVKPYPTVSYSPSEGDKTRQDWKYYLSTTKYAVGMKGSHICLKMLFSYIINSEIKRRDKEGEQERVEHQYETERNYWQKQ